MFRQEEEPIEYVDGDEYTNAQLEQLANQLLREHAKSEVCRDCGSQGAEQAVEAKRQAVCNTSGQPLVLGFKRYVCTKGHVWYQGEGQERGIGGQDPILFEEHFQSRRKREIYTSIGTPDPEIVQGLYNRTHPQGRKVNSPEQRQKHGASYYR